MKRTSIKETVKNIILAVEIVCMLTLLYFSWVYTLGTNKTPLFFRSIGISYADKQSDANDIADFSACVQPITVAVSSNKNTFSATYGDYQLSEIYSRVKNVLAESLGSAEIPKNTNAVDFNKVLSGNIIYLEFECDIPLFALCSWQGVEPSAYISDIFSDFVVLSADDEQIIIYCYSQINNQFIKIPTAARSSSLETVFGSYTSSNSNFALFCGAEYCNIRPETVISDSSAVIPKLTCHTPSIKNNQSESNFLFSAFRYDPYTVRTYEENDGTVVYVDNLSTLTITRNGVLHFNSPEKQGIEIYDKSEYLSESDKLLKITEASYSMVTLAFQGIDSSAKLLLSGVYKDDNSYIISFVRTADGIPVYSGNGYSTAYVKITDNLILSAYINLRYYQTGSQYIPILPVTQAKATLFPDTDSIYKLGIYYTDNFSDYVEAGWYAEPISASYQAAITQDGVEIEMEQN